MSKKVAVLAVNPVNGFGLFQYLEAFFENKISYEVFAVANDKHIRTNSGVEIVSDDVVANLIDKVEEFDALVFACGDAIPVFSQFKNEKYYADMFQIIRKFADEGKVLAGHCAAAMMFDFAGVTKDKEVSVHPLAKPAITLGTANNETFTVSQNMFTAQDENKIVYILPSLLEELKK